MEGRRCGDSRPQAKERGPEQTLPAQPTEQTNSADNLDFQPPELGDYKLQLAKPPSLGSLVRAAPANGYRRLAQ